MFNFLKPKSAASSASQPQNTAQPTALPPTTNAAPEAPITKRAPTQADLAPHPRIRHIVVVASGKGGVGKSTTTVNLALALQQLGKRVGILDADIYDPSVPAMLGVTGVQPQLENEQFVPIEAHGLTMLSIGSLLTDDTTPIAWRAAKATGALMQLFGQTNCTTAGLSADRYAPRYRRYSADACAAHSCDRRGDCDHTAAHRVARCAKRRGVI